MVHSHSRVRSGAGWLVLGSAVCAAGLSVAACSSRFSGCESARDCPGSAAGGSAQAGESDAPSGEAGARSNGAAGADSGAGESTGGASGNSGASGGADNAGAPSSEAGAGGEAPTPECVTDADCSDHLACNGTELCQAGVCTPGVAPCANPEPTHCDVLCAEVSGAASCTVRGQDKDKDGHFSSACVTKPGDDCNDAVASIHPGAPEICDGIDHNCNGKFGINDGLSLSGTTVAIGPNGATRSAPAIAWADDKSVYGISYSDTTTSNTSDLYFETLDKTGAPLLAPFAFNENQPAFGSGASLTWGGDRFGLSWVTTSSTVNFRTITSGGASSNTMTVDSSSYLTSAGIARAASGNWAVLYWAASPGMGAQLRGKTVSTAGIVSTLSNTLNDRAVTSNVVASGSNFVIADDSDLYGPAVTVWSASLTTPSALAAHSWSHPVVGAGSNGIAVTSIIGGSSPQFYAFGPTGSALCGPVNFADKTFLPGAIVSTPKGYLVVSTAGAVRVQEMLANCAVGTLFTVDPGPATAVGIAGSAAGYGLVWQDAVSVPKRRVFGPLFCN